MIKKPKLNWTTESQISLSRYVKYYNNMEPKKKFNWDTIWKLIHRIITAILAAETTLRTL